MRCRCNRLLVPLEALGAMEAREDLGTRARLLLRRRLHRSTRIARRWREEGLAKRTAIIRGAQAIKSLGLHALRFDSP